MLVSLAKDITSELQTLNKVMENQSEYTKNFSKYIQLNSEAKEFRKILIVLNYDLVNLFEIDLFAFQTCSRFCRSIWIQYNATLFMVNAHYMWNHVNVSNGNGQ